MTSIVDLQVRAYEDGDAKTFASYYATDARCEFLNTGQIVATNKEEIETVYAELFLDGPFKVQILKRIVNGRFVIDLERVSSGEGSGREAVAIYEVGANEIKNVWFLDNDVTTDDSIG